MPPRFWGMLRYLQRQQQEGIGCVVTSYWPDDHLPATFVVELAGAAMSQRRASDARCTVRTAHAAAVAAVAATARCEWHRVQPAVVRHPGGAAAARECLTWPGGSLLTADRSTALVVIPFFVAIGGS